MDTLLNNLPVPHDDGHFISEKVSRIVEIIREKYGGRVDVLWIPADRRLNGEAEFKIVECMPDGKKHTIFHVKDQSEFNESILARLIAADNLYNKVLSQLEIAEEAAKDYENKVWQDKIDDVNDIATSVLKSPLNVYKLGGGKEIRDYGNRVR